MAVLIFYLPFRGLSLRDRFRSHTVNDAVGLRLLPGRAHQLSSTDITALVDDAPYPIYSMSFFRVCCTPSDEVGHQYFAAAQRLKVPTEAWMHLIIHADLDQTELTETLDFIATRLGHCGLRTRPLLPSEISMSCESHPLARIQQASRSLYKKRNYLWMSHSRHVLIPPAPQQVLGVGTDGRALTIRLADIGIIDLDGRAPDNLLLPALALGYRIGIRTGSPQQFRTALAHGAVLTTASVDPHLDVICYDSGTSAEASQSYKDACAAGVCAPAMVLSEPNRLTALTDLRLRFGQLTWELHAGEIFTKIRPIPLGQVNTAA